MIQIRLMSRDDLPFCLGLVREAGWNQLEADWLRVMRLQPEGCFVAESSGQSVGTVTSCLFDRVGWVGTLLVAGAARRGGVGSALLDRSLRFLESAGAATIRLDATPLGEPMYRRAGFVDQFRVTRFRGIAHTTAATTGTSDPNSQELRDVFALDRQMVGYDRSRFLQSLIEEGDGMVRVARTSDRVTGYLITRRGNQAVQIGPCGALTADAGERLLARGLREFGGQPVYVDVARDNRAAVEAVTTAGLQPVREFVRMVRGDPVVEDTSTLWASSGPEKG